MSNLFHGVDPSLICDQHLLGIWKEIHQVLGAVKKGRSIEGHEKDFQVMPEFIADRMLSIHAEGKYRGFDFKQKYEWSDIDAMFEKCQVHEDVWLDNSPIQAYNTLKLFSRCRKCRQRLYDRLGTQLDTNCLEKAVKSLSEELEGIT